MRRKLRLVRAVGVRAERLMAADAEDAHLHTDVEPVLDDLVAHARPGLVPVGSHELASVRIHVQADDPVAQLGTRHKQVRREEAGRRVVCSTHVSLVSADNGAVYTMQLYDSVSRETQANEQLLVSRSGAWRQTCGADIQGHSGRPRGQGAGLGCQHDVVPKALSRSGGSKP